MSRFLQMVGRTGAHLQQEAAKFSRSTTIPTTSLSLYKFHSQEEVANWVHGSDLSIGGSTTSNWELGMDGRGKFSGNMSLRMQPQFEGRYRAGYAGIRSRARPTLFGHLSHDVQPYKYLSLRLRLGEGIKDAWYVNIRTSEMPDHDLWQHRLFLRNPPSQKEYEEVQIPFRDFTYTRRGEHMTTDADTFQRDRVVMVGISLLGGNAGLEGPYELGVDEIWATNQALVQEEPKITVEKNGTENQSPTWD